MVFLSSINKKSKAIEYILTNPKSMIDFSKNELLFNDEDFNLCLGKELGKSENFGGIKFLNQKFLNNEVFIEKLLENSFYLYPHIKNFLKKEEDFVINYITKDKHNSLMYFYLPSELKLNKKIMNLIMNYNSSIVYSSKEIQQNKDVMKEIISVYSLAFAFASKELKKDKEFVSEVMDSCFNIISLKEILEFKDLELFKKIIFCKLNKNKILINIFNEDNVSVSSFLDVFKEDKKLPVFLKELLLIDPYLYGFLGAFKENKDLIEIIKKDAKCVYHLPDIIYLDTIYIANIINGLNGNFILSKNIVENFQKNNVFNKILKEMVGDENEFILKNHILKSIEIVLNNNEKEIMKKCISGSKTNNNKIKF